MAKKRGDVRPNGQIRQSQVVTTFGPGAMVDLPDHAVIIGGLEHWTGYRGQPVAEERLAAKVKKLLNVDAIEFYAPPPDNDEHEVSNGLLLRSDLHRLFDRGYLTVTPALRLDVSRRLREDYSNGRSYYPLHGQEVAVPRRAEDKPDSALLAWHNEQVFLG